MNLLDPPFWPDLNLFLTEILLTPCVSINNSKCEARAWAAQIWCSCNGLQSSSWSDFSILIKKAISYSKEKKHHWKERRKWLIVLLQASSPCNLLESYECSPWTFASTVVLLHPCLTINLHTTCLDKSVYSSKCKCLHKGGWILLSFHSTRALYFWIHWVNPCLVL